MENQHRTVIFDISEEDEINQNMLYMQHSYSELAKSLLEFNMSDRKYGFSNLLLTAHVQLHSQ